jgi:hypothetical protein
VAGIAPPTPPGTVPPGGGKVAPFPADISLQLAQFARAVSAGTGIDARVIAAQAIAEGHPGDTAYNYLNIAAPTASSLGYPPSAVLAANTAGFKNLQTGIDATIAEFKSPAIGLNHEAGKSIAQQISDIANSPWAGGHYTHSGQPGSDLTRIYTSEFGAPTGKATQSSGGTSAGAQSGGGGILGAIGGLFSGPEKFFKFLTSWRFAELVGGLALLLVGLAILARAIKSASTTVTLAQGVKDVVTVGGLRGGGSSSGGGSGDASGGEISRAYAQGARQGQLAEARRQGRKSASREATPAESRSNVVSMGERPSQRARVREAASRAQGPGELPEGF